METPLCPWSSPERSLLRVLFRCSHRPVLCLKAHLLNGIGNLSSLKTSDHPQHPAPGGKHFFYRDYPLTPAWSDAPTPPGPCLWPNAPLTILQSKVPLAPRSCGPQLSPTTGPFSSLPPKSRFPEPGRHKVRDCKPVFQWLLSKLPCP